MNFCKELMDWYETYRRDLPWRRTEDPYRIWLSETILQQTRVAQGLPYYERFIARFPSIRDLALADETEVLKLWQGLGYYSRARNLHKAAQIIHAQYQDRFPEDYASIRALPGIGDYTAAAIASFSYNLCYPVMDGNVIRVMSRIHGIFEEAASQACRRQIMALLRQAIEPAQSGKFNQAIMEFGALACRPLNPVCQENKTESERKMGLAGKTKRTNRQRSLFEERAQGKENEPCQCPFRQECYAFRHGVIDQLPVKKKKEALPVYELHYLLIGDKNGLWVHKRGYNDLWRGMFDLPGLPERYWKKDESSEAVAAENVPGIEFLKHYTQVLSHRRLRVFFYKAEPGSSIGKEAVSEQEGCRKISWADLSQIAVPKNIEKFFEDFNLTSSRSEPSLKIF